MLSITHGVTGAFIATHLPQPFLAIPLILGCHYLQDWIPHWDVGTGLGSGKRSRRAALILEIGDLLLTLGIVYWWWHSGDGTDLTWALIGCGIALLPDFLEAPRNFLKWEPSWLTPLNNFHNRWHHSTFLWWLGLPVQFFILILLYFLK